MNRIATSVPASLAGYIMQIHRALFRLSTAPAIGVVGVETLDDVSVLTPEDLIIFEQDKLSLAPEETPITTRSESFWKTLDIWTDAWSREALSRKYPAFFLATNRRVEGALKELTRSDRGEDINLHVLEQLNREMRVKPKPAKGSIQELINSVLNKPRDALLGVLSNMHIENGAGTLDLALIDRTIDRLHIPDFIDGNEIFRALYGWASEVVLTKWLSGDQAWIRRSEFDRQLEAIKSAFVRQKVRARAGRVIPVSPEDKSEARSHRFISHLAMIQMDPSQVDQELIHYIRFSKEKIRLLNDGYIPDEEWLFRGDRLCEFWRTIFNKYCFLAKSTQPPEAPERTGMKIFYDVAEHREPLYGETMPEAYMTLGHLHRLSNDDYVFWHPDFKKGEKS